MQEIEIEINREEPSVSSSDFVRSITTNELTEQVSKDILAYLENATDRQKKLNLMSKKIGVHLKTLNRICQLENRPSYITVFKIYKYLFNENDDCKVLELAPSIVRDYLKKANPQSFEKSASYSSEAENEISKNHVALELVVLCSTGSLTSEEIKDRFGTFGLEIVQRLVSKKILSESKLGIFNIGPNQMNMTPETIIKMGIQVVSSYAKPQNGYEKHKNFQGFYAEGLSEEAYQQWMEIDEQAYIKKAELAKKASSLGKLRAYSFVSTDTLIQKDIL